MIRRLSQWHQAVLGLRFGHSNPPLTKEEIAARRGLSPQAVEWIEQSALRQLQRQAVDRIENDWDEV
jgi:DNA-directed RNA polymerase sigma subunit (sigma70/sigma32)